MLYNEYLMIFKVCKVNGNRKNNYEVTEDADRHIVNLGEKKSTYRTRDLIEIPCPHAIKATNKETSWVFYKHKLQCVRGEPI
ncbi:hypothetical protein H5410_001415 [Solanum commersonii]|uniref:Uncharacterized protein n=1 Tax=Solanum commersonii TaxID=4109 RepID=A0A9J6AZH9_SOLCO|nr:hypothetical protein H5410_001415 [Solanum commersonii]